MIDKDEIIIGNTYYLIGYFDNNLKIPDVETYIYVGKNVLPSDKNSNGDSWYFQDPSSFLSKGYFYENQNKEGFDIVRADEETLETIFDVSGLINELSDIENAPS